MITALYKTSDGREFESLSEAYDHEFKPKKLNKPATVYLKTDGTFQEKYDDDTMIVIFFDADEYEMFRDSDKGDWNPEVPPVEESEFFLDDSGYFAIYWNEFLEQWEFYDWEEAVGNYKKAFSIHEYLRRIDKI